MIDFFPANLVNTNIRNALEMMNQDDINIDFSFSNAERNAILNAFLAYIRTHHVRKFELKSLEVLKEIWN